MKIFLSYVAFTAMFIAGFWITIVFGLPKTEDYDALVAVSGMAVGSLGATLVIVLTNRDLKQDPR